MTKRLRPIVAIGFLLNLAACTVIRIEGAERATVTRFGILQIEPKPSAGLVTYRAEGIGLVPGLHGATLGYSREVAALAYDPDKCQAIIFELPAAESAAALWRDIIRVHPNLCYIGGDAK